MTTKTAPLLGPRCAAHGATHARRTESTLAKRSPLAVAIAAACLSPIAQADNWRVTPSISTSVTATNNSGFDDSQNDKGDVILDVAPRLKALGIGANYQFDADFGANGLVYTRNSRSDEVLPEGRATLKSTVVDRWVYFDAGARVAQTVQNPFLGRTDAATGANKLTTVSYELSPAVKHEFTPTLNASARSTFAWTRRESLQDVDAQTHQLRVEQKTVPFGWVLDATQQRTHFQGDDDPALSIGAVRAIGVYAPDARLKLGLILGRERNEFGGSTDRDNIVGALVEAAPTERTLATVTAERRFFGTGWNASLRHRSPFIGLTAEWYRRPTAQANSQDVANTTTTAQLLDAMLITRVPDPNERAVLVQDMLMRLSLPSQLGGAQELNATTPQLEQGSRVSLAFQGRLTVATFSAYLTQLTTLRRSDNGTTTTLPDATSSRQYGFSIDLNRRLDALTTADIYLESARIRRIEDGPQDFSRDRVLRMSLTRQLDTDTTASVAVRRRLRDSALSGVAGSVDETSLIVGLSHRF